MKQDEILEEEKESLFRTNDAESQTELSGDETSDSSQWPRSYRRSVDMLTRVTPTTTSFDTLFNKNQQSFVLDSFSSYGSNQRLLNKDDNAHNNSAVISVPDLSLAEVNRSCSFSQSVFNGINILCGTALLTFPYAVKEGGWLGLIVLFCFGIITCYTGILLKRCQDSSPGLHTYLDIGQAAFGISGRVFVSILLCLELYAACVEYIIMVSDNLSVLFPNTSMNIAGFVLESTQIFAITTTLIVLPTVWLRDLSLLSYLSAGGVFSSILLAFCLFWVGSVDDVGFHITGRALHLANLPVAIGIFCFGLAGHSVFPNIYSSMKEPSQFPLVLLTSFGCCTLLSISIAVGGYSIFGDAIQSQFTLNMPQQFTSSKIAIWTVVVTPMLKYAITITPVVLSLEELLPSSKKIRSKGVSLLFRTVFVLSTLVVALVFPLFATVAALIGSFTTMLIAVIFPCLCYLRIFNDRLKNSEIGVCNFIISIGVVSGCWGTYSAVTRLIGQIT